MKTEPSWKPKAVPTRPLSWFRSSISMQFVESKSSSQQSVSDIMSSTFNSDNCFTKNLAQKSTNIAASKSKINLLNLLVSNQKHSTEEKKSANVFKPIGNNVVVPINISLLAKSKSTSLSSKICHKSITALPQTTNIKNMTKAEKENPFKNLKVIDMAWKPSSKEVIPCNALTPISANVAIKKECLVDRNSAFPLANYNSSPKQGGDFKEMCDDKSKIQKQIKNLAKDFSHSQKHSFSNHKPMDPELTCLSWLLNNKSKQIKVLEKCNPDYPIARDEHLNVNADSKMAAIFTAFSKIQSCQSYRKAMKANYEPEDKPPFSFSSLIFMAIEDSLSKKLRVQDIYKWACKHYPYFRSLRGSWKNTIRHNLSFNRCFCKVKANPKNEKSPKVSLWSIHPAYRPNLLEGLKRAYAMHPNYHNERLPLPFVLRKLLNLPYRLRCENRSSSTDSSEQEADISGSMILEDQTDIIHHTIEEIFRDSYFHYGYDDVPPEMEVDSSENRELVISRDSKEDHRYCLLEVCPKIVPKRERSASSDSATSAPDEAYEFETASFTEEILDMGIVQDIMADLMVGGSDGEDEEEGLFDSGFGCMQSFEKEKRNSNSAKRKKALSKSAQSPASVGNKPFVNVKTEKNQEKMNSQSLKSHQVDVDQKHNANQKSSQNPKTLNNANSSFDINGDIGRDFAGLTVVCKSKSKYGTRSNRARWPYRKPAVAMAKRARKTSTGSVDASDDEVKRAAGSLLRLAGLIKTNA